MEDKSLVVLDQFSFQRQKACGSTEDFVDSILVVILVLVPVPILAFVWDSPEVQIGLQPDRREGAQRKGRRAI